MEKFIAAPHLCRGGGRPSRRSRGLVLRSTLNSPYLCLCLYCCQWMDGGRRVAFLFLLNSLVAWPFVVLDGGEATT